MRVKGERYADEEETPHTAREGREGEDEEGAPSGRSPSRPDKPRLNRKKFARETWAEWEEFLKRDPVLAEVRLLRAVEFMAGPEVPKITPEQIGVFKALKIAIELDKFFRRLEAEGRKQYTIGEIADEVFLPVWKL